VVLSSNTELQSELIRSCIGMLLQFATTWGWPSSMDYRGDLHGAEEQWRLAVQCDPKHSDAHFGLGMLLMKIRHNYDSAEKHLRAATKLVPSHVKPQFELCFSWAISMTLLVQRSSDEL
jgi:hypothetical protein